MEVLAQTAEHPGGATARALRRQSPQGSQGRRPFTGKTGPYVQPSSDRDQPAREGDQGPPVGDARQARQGAQHDAVRASKRSSLAVGAGDRRQNRGSGSQNSQNAELVSNRLPILDKGPAGSKILQKGLLG